MSVRPTMTIVTPCFNAARYIEETMRSVLINSAVTTGRARLQYVVCDGGSTDGTAGIVERVFEEAAAADVDTEFVSEPDRGMYDALAKGLARADGDVCAYLNAGDLYAPTAFDAVLDVLGTSEANWLTGLHVFHNERGDVTRVDLPFRYRRAFIRRGFYGTRLPFIQQESTFWAGRLTRTLDLEHLAGFRYAGDYFLWHSLAATERLFVVDAWLGGFRYHHGQLSEDKGAYRAEMMQVAEPAGAVDRTRAKLDALLWRSSDVVKRRHSRGTRFVFDHVAQAYALQ